MGTDEARNGVARFADLLTDPTFLDLMLRVFGRRISRSADATYPLGSVGYAPTTVVLELGISSAGSHTLFGAEGNLGHPDY